MADDPIAQVLEALKRSQVEGEVAGEVAPLLAEALGQIAAGLDRLAEAERNLAIQQALLDDRLLRVEHNRAFTAFNRMVTAGVTLFQRAQSSLPARLRQEKRDPAPYATWVAHELAGLPSVEQARAASNTWTQRPRISVIMTVRNGETVPEGLESLRKQAYENWELCAAVNQATGEYVSFMQETGTLSPLALYYVAEAARQGAFDVLYSDEDSLDTERRRVLPIFKPDWSPDLLTSCMYMGHLLTIRRERLTQSGGLSNEYAGAHLRDLVLRLADEPLRVCHIPRVLYHGLSPTSAPPPGPGAGTFAVRRKGPTGEMTAIVCSKSPDLLETCLASLRATADRVVRQIVVVAHEESGPNPSLRSVIQRAGAAAVTFRGAFNFAAMNNLGAGIAEAPNLLFLNDDVCATEPEWAELLAEQVSREEVGVAGAVLWYPSGVLQHAGIVAGVGDGVGHAGRYMHSSELWPWLLATRNVSAVTGACLAIRKDLFGRLGGFDTLFPNNYNDVDLCFRVRSQGYRVVCVAVPGLIHAECQSRPGIVRFEERYRFYERWADLLRSPDPYYSPALAPTEKISLNLSGDGWYRSLLAPIRT
ncbi:MAG TPA: glycosyltransferase [Candidatus Solibacter sp.]|jgi:GT2 family glycosyltransferase|nr:glycosyltransferase [Candidatus Solibacter sp.]